MALGTFRVFLVFVFLSFGGFSLLVGLVNGQHGNDHGGPWFVYTCECLLLGLGDSAGSLCGNPLGKRAHTQPIRKRSSTVV